MNTLKLSVDAYVAGLWHQAAQGLKECLTKIKQNSVEVGHLVICVNPSRFLVLVLQSTPHFRFLPSGRNNCGNVDFES